MRDILSDCMAGRRAVHSRHPALDVNFPLKRYQSGCQSKGRSLYLHIIIFAELFLFPNVNVYFVSSSGNIH